MSKKFIISLLSIISTFFLVLGCDLLGNNDQSKMDDIFNLEENHKDDFDLKCISKKDYVVENSQIKLDVNNNRGNSYHSRVSNVSNSHSKTHSYCMTK
ncbi:DUF5425 family lipoprotein [Borreliella japonica]|uniref:DUF5425 family lipoprotein n=1 Tax=Borreliella japonica TaxID=34095 RepID=UPI00264927A3|nr:DUF5425 family lipoprotein [Borreliella japonica]WKC87626.1 DUF5425 family lipoprotein [Borreliella japonica]